MWLLKKLFKFQLEKLSLEKGDIVIIKVFGTHAEKRLKRELEDFFKGTGHKAILVRSNIDDISKISDDCLKEIGLQRIQETNE